MAGSNDVESRVIVLIVAWGLACGAGPANADFIFGTPALVPNVNSEAHDYGPSLSSDGLELYFDSNRSGNTDLWVSTRPTTDDDWGVPQNLGSTVNSPAYDGSPSISSNGLELYFDSHRSGGAGGDDLWVSRRVTTDSAWSAPENLGSTINSSAEDYSASISSEGLELYFSSNRDGYRIWVTRRATTDEPWGAPVSLPSTVNCVHPGISSNGQTLFFCSPRAGGVGSEDIWAMTRTTTEDDWDAPVNIGSTVNSPSSEREPALSYDGRTLYFTSNRPDGIGGLDVWQAPVVPVVDFNGDGNVDGKDVLVMAAHWGESRPACDIGPTPLGDGIVDLQDLIALAGYIGREVDDPTLVAHWTLDDTEGMAAHDSAGATDGTVTGDAAWRAGAGMVDGALEFDGVDDFVETDFLINPEDGPFSLFAWIKGGAFGQVIVSQADTRVGRHDRPGCSWLAIDPVLGTLTTDLISSESIPSGPELEVTDGQWHRVGLVWDASSETSVLYVDDVEIAATVLPALPKAYGGLRIGTGRSLEPTTFFTGLIDDVRIYNRAVRP